ncbi:MAG: GNAT family N-acetyltransferase [Erysipelotrichales bacterium]
MVEYKTLDNIEIDCIIDTFMEAFSDYQISFKRDDIAYMLKRRSFNPSLSLGAFDNDRLVGFILNGQRTIDGVSYVYDTGTGVLKEYRNKKITQEMIEYLKPLLNEKGINKYVLEVLMNNESAYHLYSKVGFKVSREFDCYKRDKNDFNVNCDYPIKKIDNIQNDLFDKFNDIKPSWQNDIESIKAVIDSYSIYGAYHNDELIGYGIITNKTGDIPQLSVCKEYRNQHIASSLLCEMQKSTTASTLNLVNIERGCTSLEGFLKKLDFELSASQYEMILDIS